MKFSGDIQYAIAEPMEPRCCCSRSLLAVGLPLRPVARGFNNNYNNRRNVNANNRHDNALGMTLITAQAIHLQLVA
ncbi:MAG: hypothetical protein KGH66_00690 [Candidatus Micrarchaeota archaeon]|nr:hypothetical protein [Candidatus Micrarchaeota archaeon]